MHYGIAVIPFGKVAFIFQYCKEKLPFDDALDEVTQSGGGGLVREHVQTGGTWWFEIIQQLHSTQAELIQRIQAGPPG